MRVLVTNDDGIDAPGIRALAIEIVAAGHDVFVVGPASDLSGAGASIGPLHRSGPIPIEERPWPELPGVPVLAMDRPPATAVYAACIGGFGAPPDVVVSGINPGANTGHLVLHSGTVGAALTAAGLGVPAVAASVAWSDPPYLWDAAARLAAGAIPWVTAGVRGRPRVLNVNVPNRPAAEILGVRDARLAPYGEFWVASAENNGHDLRIDFRGRDGTPDPDTDAALLLAGYATVTVLDGIVAHPLKNVASSVEKGLRRPLHTLPDTELGNEE